MPPPNAHSGAEKPGPSLVDMLVDMYTGTAVLKHSLAISLKN